MFTKVYSNVELIYRVKPRYALQVCIVILNNIPIEYQFFQLPRLYSIEVGMSLGFEVFIPD
jgi:hypothetical protein